MKSALVVVAIGAVLILGARRRGDPKPVDIRDFGDAAPMTDTLQKLVPVGTPVPQAEALMHESGFRCDPALRARITVVDGKLGSGPPQLYCWNSNRIFPWTNHRDWTVVYDYDSAGIRGVYASAIIQP
jgi:hypothetical protein